jgi:hypothetical protein
MKTITGEIDDVLAMFDAVQESLGLDGEEPRHARFLRGVTTGEKTERGPV